MTAIPIVLEVNGTEREVLVDPGRTLLDVLRWDLGLTGTKENCLEAECGACTVLVDGRAVNACIVLAVSVAGCSILTVEGLATDGRLHPLQQAFVHHGAVQCGYCTPGMLMSAKALLDRDPAPTLEAIKDALVGNLCRCTGYCKILDAVQAVARGDFR